MPKCCSVYRCKGTSEITPDRSFHHFPRDSKLRTAWINRIRRVNFNPTEYSYVCSYHFTDEDFKQPNKDSPAKFRKCTLKPGSIPAWNLHGEENDERIPKRNSHTSTKARCKLELEAHNISDGDDNQQNEQQNVQNVAVELCQSRNNDTSADKVSEMVQKEMDTDITHTILELKDVKAKLHEAKHENQQLEEKLFRYKNLKENLIKSYTGLEASVFETVFQMIKRFFPLRYWSGKPVTSISVEDELLIFLMKLRLDLPYFDLGARYSVSVTTIQNIFLTYLHAFHEIFVVGCMSKLPSLEKNQSCLPESFANIANCRVIIDCTEFRIEAPRKDLEAAAQAFSNYKHYLSAKYLIGVAPNGAITFVSQGFPGSTSDKVVTDQSGIISHLKVGRVIILG